MKRLKEIAETFSVSRPIFKLTMERNGRTISMNTSDPVHKYEPTPIAGDVLSELVCSSYIESFIISRGEFVIDKFSIASRAMEEIRNSMTNFLEKNLEMKNPRQSKMYRWYYYNLPNNNDFNDALVLLYKYIRSFSDSGMRGLNIEHTKNAIAVMEAIMESYSNEK